MKTLERKRKLSVAVYSRNTPMEGERVPLYTDTSFRMIDWLHFTEFEAQALIEIGPLSDSQYDRALAETLAEALEEFRQNNEAGLLFP